MVISVRERGTIKKPFVRVTEECCVTLSFFTQSYSISFKISIELSLACDAEMFASSKQREYFFLFVQFIYILCFFSYLRGVIKDEY